MIIKQIEIKNFRLYYKQNTFEFTNGLNLIIGGSGDGKTTFFDAVEWLFRTGGTNKMDTKLISKKRIEDLLPNNSDDVRVAMAYEHNGKTKKLEKSFHFTKAYDGEVSTSNYSFLLIENNGVERTAKDGFAFDKDIPFDIRKFMMFKDEGDLFVLQSSNALKILVDNFSSVEEFDAYFAFMEYATRNADRTRDNAQKRDKKNGDRIKQLHQIIKQEQTSLSEIEHEIKEKENETVNFEGLLRNIEQGNEASKLLVSVNSRIENLSQKRSETTARIRENYTQKLLGNMWVLLGFDSIAKEYSSKVYTMGRKREIAKDFKHNYIDELEKLDVCLYDSFGEIDKLHHTILDTIAFNDRLHDEIKKIEAYLEAEFEHKKRVLVQTDGLTEEQLLANYDNISNWMANKNRAENRIDTLKRVREQHRVKLEEAEMKLRKMSEGTTAEIYAKTALVIRHIAEAFKSAKDKNKRDLLNEIENEANLFLEKLMTNDYTGTIRIIEKQNGQVESFVMDSNGCRIFNPGYTLVKSYLLSVMLTIVKLFEEKSKMHFPLIAEGSFGQYEEANGKCFFDAINGQAIIITDDYLKSANGEIVLDYEKVKSKGATTYRLEKKRPFDKKKLETLQTIVTRIQ